MPGMLTHARRHQTLKVNTIKQLVHPRMYPKLLPPNKPKVMPGMLTHVRRHQTLTVNTIKQLVHSRTYPKVLPPKQT